MTSKLCVQADVHNTSAISGGSGSGVHSDISNIIPKDILANMELEKSDPVCTSMLTEELMKLKSKEEEEKMHLQEEEWKEARHKAQELWAKKKGKELQVKIGEEKRHAEHARLEKIKWEKELEGEKLDKNAMMLIKENSRRTYEKNRKRKRRIRNAGGQEKI